MSVLPYMSILIIALAVLMYVLLDGWDLGVGILFLIASNEHERDQMIASIVPFWDGNETWLVFGGVTLFATFPVAYALALKALYLPVMVMLIALVFRGVSFEFRPHAEASRVFWNRSFALGSIIASFSQGYIVGRLIQGVPISYPSDAQALTTFLLPLLCSVAMVGGYSLLGAAWLIYKLDGETQDFGRKVSRAAWLVAIGALVLACLCASLSVPQVAQRWFALPNLPIFAVVAGSIAAAALALWRSIGNLRSDARPLQWAIVMTVLAFIGLGATIWPYVLPYQISILEGAADEVTLEFALVGIMIVLPFVLAYQLFAYHVFGGKVQHSDLSS
jgi:cytochrome d ubiquinol oxidase subunit II